MKLKELIVKHGFTVENYNSTVDQLCKNGIGRGCYQDYQLLSFVLKVLTELESEIEFPGKKEKSITVSHEFIKTCASNGYLELNSDLRLEFDGNILHCGDVVELSIDGKNWVKTQIEHNGQEYYAVENPKIWLVGLYCRFPEVAK